MHGSFLNLSPGDIARLTGVRKPSDYVCCMMALVVLLDFVISQCVCACVSRRCEGKLMA